MTDKQIIIDGCEFQSDCIEYKDISYLKIMPICAIHELSIACHDKVNKCKYYKLYKQLKRKEQECEKINLTNERLVAEKYIMNEEILKLKRKERECDKYKAALDEIERYRVCEINDEDGEEGDVILGIIDEAKEQNDGQTNIL